MNLKTLQPYRHYSRGYKRRTQLWRTNSPPLQVECVLCMALLLTLSTKAHPQRSNLCSLTAAPPAVARYLRRKGGGGETPYITNCTLMRFQHIKKELRIETWMWSSMKSPAAAAAAAASTFAASPPRRRQAAYGGGALVAWRGTGTLHSRLMCFQQF